MTELTAEAWDAVNNRRSQEDAKNLFNALAEDGTVSVEGGGNSALKEEREEKDQAAPVELIEASVEPVVSNEGTVDTAGKDETVSAADSKASTSSADTTATSTSKSSK